MKKNKNILFLTRLFYPHIGGVEKHVFEISKGLIKKGYKVTIVTEMHDKTLLKKEQINGMTIFRIPISENQSSKKYVIWKWLFIYIKLIKQAEVIHCHDVYFWYFPFRFIFPQKKVFTTFHGYESYPISRKAIIVRKLSEFLSFGNICIGDFIKKWYGTKPTFVSYGGISGIQNSEFRVQNRKKSSSAVFIGRLDQQTGIKTYVQAFKQVRKIVPRFQLLVIGDGKFRKEIEKDVKVSGFLRNPEEYFRNHRFAFVSRYLSILEAMIAKRLVFALYDNPVKRDYLLMSPFAKSIIIASSATELVDKVQYYLKHPMEEKKVVEDSYEWAKQQTWSVVIDMYIKLWSIK